MGNVHRPLAIPKGIRNACIIQSTATTLQDNATAESSADIGAAQYDNRGLPSQITDALGQATTITRNALGRPTGLVFADGKTSTLRYDLTANSKGYLSEIVDRSGTTEYTRDALATEMTGVHQCMYLTEAFPTSYVMAAKPRPTLRKPRE